MTAFRMGMAALALALVGFGAEAQEKAWVQIESYPSEETAKARASAYAGEFDNVQVMSGGSWHAIVLGPFAPDEAAGALAELRRAGRIPGDSFVTDGAQFEAEPGAPVTAEATPPADPAAEPVAEPAPEAAPADETVKEARASEAALSKDERKELQAALKWYGHYDSAIDGSFGPGTRNSMAAWQEASGFEPTGVLTTHQRATLTANHAADLAEFGFETVTEAEAGIEITLPLALVQFDHYEPPFVHFAEKNGSGLRVMLISEPGGEETLAGLYDILQTLDVVPETGAREKKDRSFSIEGQSASVQSLAYAETRDGMVKGYLVVWNPADAARMERILPAVKSSFRGVGAKALDPGLVPMEASVREGMLAGLAVRQPKAVATGFYVDDAGHVATALANVTGCAKLTLGLDSAATVLASDEAAGVALLQPTAAMAPLATGALASASPRAGAEVSIPGFSYGARLPAPVLTFGALDAAEGAMGEPGFLRLVAPLMAGDFGGPVLDASGRVLGVTIPQATGAAKTLPQGMALAAGAEALASLMQGAGVTGATPGADAPLSPDALNTLATGMTVQVACWGE